jgi:hypothetical protein
MLLQEDLELWSRAATARGVSMDKPPPTDEQIQHWVSERYGFVPPPAWIAYCKRLCGLPVDNVRAYQQSQFNPCPPEHQHAITKAFRHFGILPPEQGNEESTSAHD